MRPSSIIAISDGRGRATILDRDASIEVTASPALRHLHIFNPRDADAFCVEPVSAMPDAFNQSPAELHVIATGGSLSVWMEIAVRER